MNYDDWCVAGKPQSTQFIANQIVNSNIEAERDHLRVGDHIVRVLTMKEAVRPKAKTFLTLTEINGDVSGYRERLFKFVEAQNFELSFSERIAPAKGFSYGGKTTLLSGMQRADEFSTLVLPDYRINFSIAEEAAYYQCENQNALHFSKRSSFKGTLLIKNGRKRLLSSCLAKGNHWVHLGCTPRWKIAG